jgi:isopenicillin N synthase-like dioxygenase
MTSTDPATNLAAEMAALVEQLARHGYFRLSLHGRGRTSLERLRAESAAFFARPEGEKSRYGTADFHHGYRPYGRQYSATPDRPDLNVSFAYWGDRQDLIPHGAEIGGLVSACHDYWDVMADLSKRVVAEIGRRLGSDRCVRFAAATHLEVNAYFADAERDLLQDRHEDGHLFTIVSSNGTGLEIEGEDGMRPFEFGEAEMILMAGSLLTELTGGWVSPLYHQVRNHRVPGRMSVLFIVNPEVDQVLTPLVTNAANEGVDLVDRARTNGLRFGLPEAPI